VVSHIGLTIRDLMPDPAGSSPNGKPKPAAPVFPTANAALDELQRKHGKSSAVWTYRDAAGSPVGLVVRWDLPGGKKDIRPLARHDDGWRIGAMPDPRPLYRLPDLAEAEFVTVVEGEKVAEAAWSLGLTATTSAGGALAAHKTDWGPLAGKKVMLLPDNNSPGQKFSDDVVAILVRLTPPAVVKIVKLPGLPEGGDLVDWIEAHGDAAEPEDLRRQIEALADAAPEYICETTHTGAGSPESWPEPVPLMSAFDPPPFPVDVLPPWMNDFATALAEEKQVPVDLPALLMLGAAAAGIARKVTVTPWPGWRNEPTNLYVMCCLPPGERKSQTFSEVFAPVMALEAEMRERAEPAVREAESRLRVAQKRVDHLEGKLAKTDDSADRAKLTQELTTARDELQMINVPALPLLRVDDDTPEMLAQELVRQGGRLLAASPEARTLENIERYSNMPNLDIFLKAHAGDDLRSGRISRGRDAIDRPALTCVFSPQPCVLESLGETPELRGRGLLARWFYGLPTSVVGFRKVRGAAVPCAVRATYEAAVLGLWQIGYSGNGEETSINLVFVDAAAAELAAFEEWKERLLRPGGDLSSCGGWGNKLGGLCVRLAAILHVADGILAGSVWKATPIPVNVVRRAVNLCCNYAVPHALAAFDRIGATETLIGARAVMKWAGGRPDPTAVFSKRDVFNGCRGAFDSVDDLQPALDLLERHYLIRSQPDPESRRGPGRKPSPVFDVHPRAFDSAAAPHNTQNPQNSGLPTSNRHSA
jgi:hypothetical protein